MGKITTKKIQKAFYSCPLCEYRHEITASLPLVPYHYNSHFFLRRWLYEMKPYDGIHYVDLSKSKLVDRKRLLNQ